MDLAITMSRSPAGAVEIAPCGEVDLSNAYEIREAVNAVLLDTAQDITVDLRQVSLIDSIGIGVLVACHHAAAASGIRLGVSNPNPIVRRQLWVSGLLGLLCAPARVPNQPGPDDVPEPPAPGRPG